MQSSELNQPEMENRLICLNKLIKIQEERKKKNKNNEKKRRITEAENRIEAVSAAYNESFTGH